MRWRFNILAIGQLIWSDQLSGVVMWKSKRTEQKSESWGSCPATLSPLELGRCIHKGCAAKEGVSGVSATTHVMRH